MADYGIKIAKPNVKIQDATLKDLVFHSKYPLLKIKEIGSGTINYTNDGSATEDLVATHNLGYTPLFRFLTQWYDIDVGAKNTTYRNAPFIDTLVGGSIYFDARPFVNTTELRYNVSSFDGNGGSISLDYIYAIYYDPDDNP